MGNCAAPCAASDRKHVGIPPTLPPQGPEFKAVEYVKIPTLDMTQCKLETSECVSVESKRSSAATTGMSFATYSTASLLTEGDDKEEECNGAQTNCNLLQVPRREAVQESPRAIEERKQSAIVNTEHIRVVPALKYSDDNLLRPVPAHTTRPAPEARRMQLDVHIEKALALSKEQKKAALAAKQAQLLMPAPTNKAPTPRPAPKMTDIEEELVRLGYVEPRFEESEYVATPSGSCASLLVGATPAPPQMGLC